MVRGIVLAAGRSERMGRTKALLDVAGRSFLAAAVSALREGGCGEVVVVARRGADDVAREAEASGARVVWNPDPAAEQIDSVRLGLPVDDATVTAAVVLPVDHPLVAGATVLALLRAHEASPDAVIRPTHGKRPGHPTLFPRSVWPALAADPLPRGARTVVESEGTKTVEVAVEDAGVVKDIDTPALYRRHVEGAR